MAEHFHGKSVTVHLSNGATQSLMIALSKIAFKKMRTSEDRAVAEFLESRAKKYSVAQFSLLNPPAEIQPPKQREFLALVLAEFITLLHGRELTWDVIDIEFDDQLRIDWLHRMLDLYQAIAESDPRANIPALKLNLDTQEADQISLMRQSSRARNLKKYSAQAYSERTDCLKELASLANTQTNREMGGEYLRAAYEELSEIAMERGLQMEAKEWLCRLLPLYKDDAQKLSLTQEIIASLEEK